MDKIEIINKAMHATGLPYAEGVTVRRFRWLHLRYETGRYHWVDGPMAHFQWYWDEPLFWFW
jgi:hypothetical protein